MLLMELRVVALACIIYTIPVSNAESSTKEYLLPLKATASSMRYPTD